MQDRFREGDILTRDEREGDRFLLFLGSRRDDEDGLLARRTSGSSRTGSRSSSRRGWAASLFPTCASARARRRLRPRPPQRPREPGAPDPAPDRRCPGGAELRQRLRERDQRETLLELIYNRSLWTAFQPIVEIETRADHGPRGRSPAVPGAPSSSLPWSCSAWPRASASSRSWSDLPPPGLRGLGGLRGPRASLRQHGPATVRDPSFLGRGVLDYLGPRLSPRFVTLEITERQVIENLTLYREAMHSFLEMGFSFAIDDVGAGYSGLETMASTGRELPEDRHGPGSGRPSEDGQPAGGEGDPGHGLPAWAPRSSRRGSRPRKKRATPWPWHPLRAGLPVRPADRPLRAQEGHRVTLSRAAAPVGKARESVRASHDSSASRTSRRRWRRRRPRRQGRHSATPARASSGSSFHRRPPET